MSSTDLDGRVVSKIDETPIPQRTYSGDTHFIASAVQCFVLSFYEICQLAIE
jgi:hypothetical protein